MFALSPRAEDIPRRHTLRRRPSPYWTLQITGWSAFALISILTLLPIVAPAMIPRLIATKATRALLGVGVSDLLRRLLDDRRAVGRWRMLGVAVAIYVLGLVWYVAFVVVTRLWAPRSVQPIDWTNMPHLALESAVVLTAWSALYVAIGAWQRAERARLDALRSQLNPHFLFNALSSIRTMIAEDPTRARDMVTGFADVLRRSLDATSITESPLRDEVAAVEEYLAIERIRFETALDVAVDVVPPADAYLVPTFLLQPLVENAVTHGRRTSPTPLRIRVRATPSRTGVRIEVANTGVLVHGHRDGGLGVANVRERLALLRPGRHRFTLTQDDEWVRAVIEV